MNRIQRGGLAIVCFTCLVLFVACADAPRPVANDPETGFALYRSGRLGPADLKVLCDLGVEEILVLDGEGRERECVLRDAACPGLRVRYDHAQEEDVPVAADFLEAFDAWIEEARSKGRKVAFRCRHGWHRTGRLAAYYRLRFEGASVVEAQREMHTIGRMMWRHPTLDSQVADYGELLAGRPCTGKRENCPDGAPDPGLDKGRFAEDVCGGR